MAEFLVNLSGRVVDVEESRVPSLLQDGFRQATPDEIQEWYRDSIAQEDAAPPEPEPAPEPEPEPVAEEPKPAPKKTRRKRTSKKK